MRYYANGIFIILDTREQKSSDIAILLSIITVPLCSCRNIKNCIHDKIHIPLPVPLPFAQSTYRSNNISPLLAGIYIFIFFTRVSPLQLLNTDGVFKAHQCWRVARGDTAELWILTQVPTIIPVRVTWILWSNANVTTEIFSLPPSTRIYNILVRNYPLSSNASPCTNPITPVISGVTRSSGV